MSSGVPALDLRRFESDRALFVEETGRAYRRFGFCGFTHHGISDEIIDSAYGVFREFFALPADVKQQYQAGPGGQRAYTPFGIEQAKDGSVPDLKEFWHVGREMGPDNPWPDILTPNRWPTEVTGFREHALALYDALDQLGKVILQVIALGLGLEATWFAGKVGLGNSILRAIHYPPIDDGNTPAVRAARHEDINLITLLIGSDEAGLEILSREGRWVPVTSIPGTIVVNIGDMMQRLTNHVLPSTPHQVVNPPGAKLRQSRYSIPFFLHPNPDLLIRTLPECITAENPNRYPEAITAHDFLLQRLKEIKLL